MRIIMFLLFLLALAKGGLLISLGVLIRNHFETVLTVINRKPIAEDLLESKKWNAANRVMKMLGLFIILIGVAIAIIGLMTMLFSVRMPMINMNFKF